MVCSKGSHGSSIAYIPIDNCFAASSRDFSDHIISVEDIMSADRLNGYNMQLNPKARQSVCKLQDANGQARKINIHALGGRWWLPAVEPRVEDALAYRVDIPPSSSRVVNAFDKETEDSTPRSDRLRKRQKTISDEHTTRTIKDGLAGAWTTPRSDEATHRRKVTVPAKALTTKQTFNDHRTTSRATARSNDKASRQKHTTLWKKRKRQVKKRRRRFHRWLKKRENLTIL